MTRETAASTGCGHRKRQREFRQKWVQTRSASPQSILAISLCSKSRSFRRSLADARDSDQTADIAKAKLLNQDIIAFGARLARYLRPELKAKSIRNLFRCAFKRACPDLPVAQVRWDDDAASP